MRKRVYIAGPISRGDLAHNINQGTAAFVALAKAGFAPWCPMWSCYAKPCEMIVWPHGELEVMCHATAMGNDEMVHADWLGVDLPWVECSHAVLRLPGESTGADMETAHAAKHGIPVFESVEELVRFFTEQTEEQAA